MDSHALVWPLELGIWTPILWCGPFSWGYGLPRFGVASWVKDVVLDALVWPLWLWIWTSMLWCGLLSWAYGVQGFGVAPGGGGGGDPSVLDANYPPN